jgi:hypothetical protein
VPRVAKDWSRQLPKPIKVGRKKLRRLHDVRAHLLRLPKDHQHMVGWQNVAGLLIEAAAGRDTPDIEVAFRLAMTLHR